MEEEYIAGEIHGRENCVPKQVIKALKYGFCFPLAIPTFIVHTPLYDGMKLKDTFYALSAGTFSVGIGTAISLQLVYDSDNRLLLSGLLLSSNCISGLYELLKSRRTDSITDLVQR